MKKTVLFMAFLLMVLMVPSLSSAEKSSIPLFTHGVQNFYDGVKELAAREGTSIGPLKDMKIEYMFNYVTQTMPSPYASVDAHLRPGLGDRGDSIWITMGGDTSVTVPQGVRLLVFSLQQCGMSEKEILSLGQKINGYLIEKNQAKSASFRRTFQEWSDATRCFFEVEVDGKWDQDWFLSYNINAFVKK